MMFVQVTCIITSWLFNGHAVLVIVVSAQSCLHKRLYILDRMYLFGHNAGYFGSIMLANVHTSMFYLCIWMCIYKWRTCPCSSISLHMWPKLHWANPGRNQFLGQRLKQAHVHLPREEPGLHSWTSGSWTFTMDTDRFFWPSFRAGRARAFGRCMMELQGAHGAPGLRAIHAPCTAWATAATGWISASLRHWQPAPKS